MSFKIVKMTKAEMEAYSGDDVYLKAAIEKKLDDIYTLLGSDAKLCVYAERLGEKEKLEQYKKEMDSLKNDVHSIVYNEEKNSNSEDTKTITDSNVEENKQNTENDNDLVTVKSNNYLPLPLKILETAVLGFFISYIGQFILFGEPPQMDATFIDFGLGGFVLAWMIVKLRHPDNKEYITYRKNSSITSSSPSTTTTGPIVKNNFTGRASFSRMYSHAYNTTEDVGQTIAELESLNETMESLTGIRATYRSPEEFKPYDSQQKCDLGMCQVSADIAMLHENMKNYSDQVAHLQREYNRLKEENERLKRGE